MATPSLLAELRSRDIRLRADGDRLHLDAPSGALTPDLREQLRHRKDEIIAFLRTAERLARQQRAIVPLQPLGTRMPIFGVGGHNGDVFCYRALATALGEDQPFFGLQPPGLDGQGEPLTRVAEYAAYFAPQIRTFWSGGPCVIAGFCAGGGIAFETAQRLVTDGAEVAFVALFGTPYPTAYRMLSQARMRIAREMERAAMHARALASLSNEDRRRYIHRKLAERRARQESEEAGASDEVLALRARVEKAAISAVRRYTPQSFPGHVALFLPSCKSDDTLDMPLRWRTVARTFEVRYGPDECTGDRMLRDPYARIFAGLFSQCAQGIRERR